MLILLLIIIGKIFKLSDLILELESLKELKELDTQHLTQEI